LLRYILRRLMLIVPTFFGITLVVFTITRLVPGGPIERAIADAQEARGKVMSVANGGPALSEEQLEQLKAYYGFDKPILVGYFEWLGRVIKLDLGESSRYGEPVWDAIKERLPVSIYYGVISVLLTYLVCVPLGILKAIKHGSKTDHVTSFMVYAGYAVPSYAFALILLVLFASRWELFPLGGFHSDEFSDLDMWGKAKDLAYHSVLPLVAYMIEGFAVTTFLMKNALLDNLASDFVRTAIAKGLNFRQAVMKHAFRNSLIPIATHFGNNISAVLAGSFLIEKIFNINGFGLLGYEAVVERDYPTVMGILVISAFLQLLGNLLSDLCVAFVDPRVEFK